MATLFISDLHIDASRPAITSQFIDFLKRDAAEADALYILGDLFESWIGDDDPDPAQQASIEAIRGLTASGVPCFVMRGNRDFLLGMRFCDASGAVLLPDPVLLTLHGQSVLVMHGDALCTDDRAYQRLRATVRNTDWQRQFLALGVAQRRALAAAARDGSRAHTAAVAYEITDVNSASVTEVLRNSGTQTLLHGHTHRPAVHALQVDDRPCIRIVLGDWYSQGSALRWDERGYELLSLPRARGPE
ncbi:MAG TPA: UDP-2,3-diacylglucosamine diphosphatase [Steroidobacteraceae bacterium]|nr:UDP-2,3-diacylglucosamine diphosphatase [Steroidobacteraceae bacterium]